MAGQSGLSATSGTSGSTGSNGSTGNAGTSGDSATSGTSGSTGSTGSTGVAGQSGLSATSGSSGSTGSNGSSGIAGSSGLSATSGTSGSTGSTGSSGVGGQSGLSATSGTSGSTGSNGSAGASGLSASSGTSGSSGSTGSSGIDGQSGLSATSGTSGSTGSTGSNGVGGQSGLSATSGSSGSTGSTGSSGVAGISGLSATSGTSGSTGSTGSSGNAGQSGLSATSGTSGSTGTTGSAGVGGQSATSGTSGSSGSTGSSGVGGQSGLSATSGSSGSTGSNGSSGVAGSSGESATSGTSGSTGSNGSSGVAGQSSLSATSGTSGSTGSTGSNGVGGQSGLSATSGTSGSTGTTGSTGVSGANGTSGTSGTAGSSGVSINGTAGISGGAFNNYVGNLVYASSSNQVQSIPFLSASLANNTFYITGSTVLTGSLFTTGSNTLVGNTSLTGSLNISGSTTQVGNNTLLGNTTLSGSIIISGSGAPGSPTSSIAIYGNTEVNGYMRYLPVSTNIDSSISASYIYVSGSTNDLYFTQNGSGYANTTRLRWLEGNLYTGLLNGGVITSASSTVYNVSSGSGIIVNLNASLNNNPFPTIKYLNWGNLTASISAFTASYQQCFVGIDDTGLIYAQGTPFTDGQFDTLINIGNVLFQNGSTINGFKTQPSVAYGFEQSQNVFNRAFGPLKISGFSVLPSGSSTGSVTVGNGIAYAPGANYPNDPNNPSYVTDPGTNISKFFRYYDSGSGWVYNTNGGAGYPNLDPVYYSNNGTLTTVGGGNFSIQRLFWYPNSATKAIVAYYGNKTYPTLNNAIANLNIESFTEAPNTAANAIYLGAYAIKGGTGTDIQNPLEATWIPGGLFRSVGGSGGGGSTISNTLAGLSDVSLTTPSNYQALVYDFSIGKWINSSNISASIYGNAATATSSSYALSASFSQTASYALNAGSSFPYTGSAIITGSLGVTGSLSVTNGGFYLSQSAYLNQNQGSLGPGTVTLQTDATSSYISAFYNYALTSGSNSRAGQIIAIWNGSSIQHTEVTTQDIGNTSNVYLTASLSGANVLLTTVLPTSGWTIKSVVNLL